MVAWGHPWSRSSKVKVIQGQLGQGHGRSRLSKIIQGQGYPKPFKVKVIQVQGHQRSRFSKVNIIHLKVFQFQGHPKSRPSKVKVIQDHPRSSSSKASLGHSKSRSSKIKATPTTTTYPRLMAWGHTDQYHISKADDLGPHLSIPYI